MMHKMELQLGLALPSYTTTTNSTITTTSTTMKEPMTSNVYDSEDGAVGLGQLGLVALKLGSYSDCNESFNISSNRNDSSALDNEQPITLPLFLNNQPTEDHNSSSGSNKIVEGEEMVWWQPITHQKKRSCRKDRTNSRMYYNRTVCNGCIDCYGGPRNSKFVKVKMEGVAIARKIDICRYNSFGNLMHTLLGMFGLDGKNFSGYKLVYQDREGGWLLAEDVTWRSFIVSAQRLKLMKSACC